eukprot:SAG31_NODE_784_length_12112_cov_10.538666_15_plen_79_part_00
MGDQFSGVQHRRGATLPVQFSISMRRWWNNVALLNQDIVRPYLQEQHLDEDRKVFRLINKVNLELASAASKCAATEAL